jgi:hypothetical protein
MFITSASGSQAWELSQPLPVADYQAAFPSAPPPSERILIMDHYNNVVFPWK